MSQSSIDEIARGFGVPAEQVSELVERACARLPQEHYYVFRADTENRGTGAGKQLARTIAAFPSPDDALAFAQGNGYPMPVQLRSISTADLVKLLLHEPSVGAALFLQSTGGDERRAGFPPSITIARQALVDQLGPLEESRIELTAQAFDALRFGVDFGRRGAFRVALTEAVEAVVAGYVPPPGSIDSGPRSVYATTAVEAWLRANGFPHANQRRWIDVAGEPGWNGADELYEIDCGTRQRLFVQLLIHNGGDRQYIGRVVVTS